MKQLSYITRFALLGCLLLGYASSGLASDAWNCGSLENNYGPFDYTNPSHYQIKLPVVEKHHFSRQVETLKGGQSGTVMGDLDYTLRAFPNHHRALTSMARWMLINKLNPGELFYSAECYFERALRFKPDDGHVLMIYGIYLHKKGKLDDAITRYNQALKFIPRSSEAHYNLALAYLDRKKHKLALKHAEIAYQEGFPLPGLKNKLKRLGLWTDNNKNSKSK